MWAGGAPAGEVLAVVEDQVIVAFAELGRGPGDDRIWVVVAGVGPDGDGSAGGEDGEGVDPDAGSGLAAAGNASEMDDISVAEIDPVMVEGAWLACPDMVATAQASALVGGPACLRF